VDLVVGDHEVAKEIVDEAFTQLYVHWRKVSGYDRPGAWVRKVAIRLAVKDRDRHPRSEPLPVELPKMQRAAVVLHYFNDLPVSDVADALGCRESTVKVHLHRARQSLGERLTIYAV
jgi:RNA polymerase sigma-70 factor (ECF subfamily)